LNVYKKNHLKQLNNDKLQHENQQDNSASTHLVEEAIQAKANCSNLQKDLNFLLKCLNIFDTTCSLYDDTASSLKYSDFTLDETSIEDLTNLVLSAQIASITTCSSELVIKYQNISNSKSTILPHETPSAENYSNTTLVSHLTQLSVQILDKYLNIVHFLDTKLSQANLFRNLSAKCIYVIMLHLDRLIQIDNDFKLTSPLIEQQVIALQLVKDLEIFSSKLLKMLIELFKTRDNKINENSNINKSPMVSYKLFNVKLYYTNSDLFNFLNNGNNNTHRFFSILLNLFKTLYKKCKSINSSHKQLQRASSKSNANLNQTPAKTINTELHLNKEIKNIDDPSSDEETVVTPTAQSNLNKEDEDPDEYLLIGSWFEDQLLNQSNIGQTSTNTTAANNANNNNTAPTNNANEANYSNNENDKNNSDIENKILTSLSFSDELMTNLLDFIKDLLINDGGGVFVKEFVKCYSNSQAGDFCEIINEIDTTIDTSFLSEKFLLSFYRFIEFLIVRNVLDYEKQDIFISFLSDNTNKEVNEGDEKKDKVSSQNLFMSKRYLSILCQIFVFRLKNNSVVEKTKDQIVKIWDSFLKLIETKIEQRLNEDGSSDGKILFCNRIFIQFYSH
jgi:hypothetical protein